jgi:hypothetical protein
MANNAYKDKLEEYISNIPIYMYVFEVEYRHVRTNIVLVYKEETLSDLYNKVCYSFGCNVKKLFFYSAQGENILIPPTPRIKLSNFVYEYEIKRNALSNLYAGSSPAVYKIYLEE